MSSTCSGAVVGIDTLEHAQSVLKSMRSRGSSARNYQTMGQASLGEGARGLNEFNSMIVDSGKELAKKQEERQKEEAILDLIGGGPSSSKANSNDFSVSVSHTLRSDRYEVSPSKISALTKDSLVSEAGLFAADHTTGGAEMGVVRGKMERMALNRPRKVLPQKQQQQPAYGKNKKASGDDDDDDEFLNSDDDYDDRDGDYRVKKGGGYGGMMDTPPKSYHDEPKYDSDEDEGSLNQSEMGQSRSHASNNAAAAQGRHSIANIRQGSTSTMTNGVKNKMIRAASPHSSPDGTGLGPGRVTVNNSVEATTKESQDFADGLKYMMEASLNDHDRSSANLLLSNPSKRAPGPLASRTAPPGAVSQSSSSVGPSHTHADFSTNMSASGVGGGKSVAASMTSMDFVKNKGAVLKKGGLFVRAGGLRKAVRGSDAK